jgi:hypothetical protein
VSVSAVLYPRWPPLLKIEISSKGQNWSILSQKVPKFELYKHNDELLMPDTILEENHPRIISAKFEIEIGSVVSEKIFFLISSPLFSNLHNRSK